MNNEIHQASNADTEQLLDGFWRQAQSEIEDIKPSEENWKIQTLPLARIKKIMKTEEFILQELEKDRLKQEGIDTSAEDAKSSIKFMIAGEAPVVVSRACELLIGELTLRAWQHTERNRRRTLQKQDIHAAVSESDVYDFLIDIVPRVSTSTAARSVPAQTTAEAAAVVHGMPPQMDPTHFLAEYRADPTHFQNMLMMQQHMQQQQQQAVTLDPGDVSQLSQSAQGWTDHSV